LRFTAVASVAQQVGEGDLGDRGPALVAGVDGCPVGVLGRVGAILLGEAVSQ
jgi:hypothetical protein